MTGVSATSPLQRLTALHEMGAADSDAVWATDGKGRPQQPDGSPPEEARDVRGRTDARASGSSKAAGGRGGEGGAHFGDGEARPGDALAATLICTGIGRRRC